MTKAVPVMKADSSLARYKAALPQGHERATPRHGAGRRDRRGDGLAAQRRRERRPGETGQAVEPDRRALKVHDDTAPRAGW